MGSISGRCRAALLAKGLEATPENLVRLSEQRGEPITLEYARLFLSMDLPPEIVEQFARASRALGARMIWVTTGRTVPYVTEAMLPEVLELIELIESLSLDKVERLLQRGKRLAKK